MRVPRNHAARNGRTWDRTSLQIAISERRGTHPGTHQAGTRDSFGRKPLEREFVYFSLAEQPDRTAIELAGGDHGFPVRLAFLDVLVLSEKLVGYFELEASGPGPDVTRSYGELTLGRGYMADLCELLRRDGLELAGNWHVHPSGEDQPSSIDMDCIAELLDYRKNWEARTERALMVIYTPPYLRSDNWKATPWVFHWGHEHHRGAHA